MAATPSDPGVGTSDESDMGPFLPTDRTLLFTRYRAEREGNQKSPSWDWPLESPSAIAAASSSAASKVSS